MPGVRRFFRETAYAVLATTAVAVLLVVVFGFSGIWATVVSVTAGMVLGRVLEGCVGLARAYRAGAARPAGEPGAAQDPSGA